MENSLRQWLRKRIPRKQDNKTRSQRRRPMQQRDQTPIKVFVRVRPFSEQETEREEASAVEIFQDESKIKVIDQRHSQETSYFFDGIFGPTDNNKTLYETIARPSIVSLLNGCNSALLTYGQTGTGKTYTLMESGSVTQFTIEHMFERINQDEKHSYKVTCSFVQVYQDKVYDLLNSEDENELPVREHPKKGVYVARLTQHAVNTSNDALDLLERGKHELIIAETRMVRHSSRSHSIFQLCLERRLRADSIQFKDKQTIVEGESKATPSNEGEGDLMTLEEDVIIRGKMDICDLAGSERLGKTMAEGIRLSEAKHINSSLLELGNVIYALSEGTKRHIPFRNSTLTRLLQQCLGPKCRTNFIVCVAPSMSEAYETRCSLNFGTRARKITNKERMHSNIEVDYQIQCRKLSKKIEALERQLECIQQEHPGFEREMATRRDTECQTVFWTRSDTNTAEKTAFQFGYLMANAFQSTTVDITNKKQSRKFTHATSPIWENEIATDEMKLLLLTITLFPCEQEDHGHSHVHTLLSELRMAVEDGDRDALQRTTDNVHHQLHEEWQEITRRWREETNQTEKDVAPERKTTKLAIFLQNNSPNYLDADGVATNGELFCQFLYLQRACVISSMITVLLRAANQATRRTCITDYDDNTSDNSSALATTRDTYTLEAMSGELHGSEDGSYHVTKEESSDDCSMTPRFSNSSDSDEMFDCFGRLPMSNSWLGDTDDTSFGSFRLAVMVTESRFHSSNFITHADMSADLLPLTTCSLKKRFLDITATNSDDSMSTGMWLTDDVKTSTRDACDLESLDGMPSDRMMHDDNIKARATDGLLAKVNALESNNLKVMRRLTVVMKESKSTEQKLKQVEGEKKRLAAELRENNEELQATRSTNKHLEERVRKLEEEKAARNDQLLAINESYQRVLAKSKEQQREMDHSIAEIKTLHDQLMTQRRQEEIIKADNHLITEQLEFKLSEVESLHKELNGVIHTKRTLRTTLRKIMVKTENIPESLPKRSSTFRRPKSPSKAALETELFVAIEKNLALEAIMSEVKAFVSEENTTWSCDVIRRKAIVNSRQRSGDKAQDKTSLRRNASLSKPPGTDAKKLRRSNSERVTPKKDVEEKKSTQAAPCEEKARYPRTSRIKEIIAENQKLTEESIRLRKKVTEVESDLEKANKYVQSLIEECAMLESESERMMIHEATKVKPLMSDNDVIHTDVATNTEQQFEEPLVTYDDDTSEVDDLKMRLKHAQEIRTQQEEKSVIYQQEIEQLRSILDSKDIQEGTKGNATEELRQNVSLLTRELAAERKANQKLNRNFRNFRHELEGRVATLKLENRTLETKLTESRRKRRQGVTNKSNERDDCNVNYFDLT